MPRPLYPRERAHVPIVQEAVWATGPVWTCAESLVRPGFDPRTSIPLPVAIPAHNCVRKFSNLTLLHDANGAVCAQRYFVGTVTL